MLDPGNIFNAVIRSTAFGGDGVTSLDGEVCFIPGTIPGETVCARLESRKKNFCRAVPLEILAPSPDRVEPHCPLALRPYGRGRAIPDYCPGCAYQHMTYARELALKQQQFEELFRHAAGLEQVPIEPPIGAPSELGYRNKMTLHAHLDEGRVSLGYYQADNRTVLDITACPLVHESLNNLLQETLAKPGFFHTLHREMEATFRYTPQNGAMFWRNHPSAKMSWLKENTPIGEISVPPGCFFQINPAGGGELVNQVAALTRELKPDCFIDLYCGVGLFGATAATQGVKRIIGVDIDGPAIQAADYNLRRYGAADFNLFTGSAEKILKKLKGEYNPATTLLVADPPRTGLELPALQHLCTTEIAEIVYISCGADTLCRDLRRLIRAGYRIRRTQLIDMFPRTPHFESITWLSK